jgi:folate-binding protein YgfZ
MSEPTPPEMPAHYGDPAAEYEQAHVACALFDLSPRGKVELTGPEAAVFLHNLCTNDIRNLAPGAGCEAFLTTNKAKVVAYLTVFHRPGAGPPSLWLDVAPGLGGKTLRHLDLYVLSSQVELTDRGHDFAQLRLAGPQARAVLAKALGKDITVSTDLQNETITLPDGSPADLRRVDALGVPGYDLVCPRDRAADLWRLLTEAGARPAGRDTFEALRVEAGTPAQGPDVDETTFAPEVGRTARAICYAKGCYLGQEPIVMARDRGQVNRTLLGVKLPGGPVPHGSLLYREGKEVGRVTSSVVSPRLGTAVGLAYVRRGHQEPGTVLEVDAAGTRRPAEVTPLPFLPFE